MSRTGGVTPGKKQGGLRLLQIFLGAAFLALVGFAFAQNVLAPRKQREVPERLGALELVSSVQGPEALAQINRLHGIEINLLTAYIARYGHGNELVTAWVGKAENEYAAAELMKRMIEGIERSRAGFNNLQQLTVAGQEVFQVQGQGGQHFFYNPEKSEGKVIWISIEKGDILSLLKQAIKTF